MAEDSAVEIEQRHAHITRRTHRPYVWIVAINIEKIIGDVNQSALVDNPLAGRAVDNHFQAIQPVISHPKRQSHQPGDSGKYSVTQAPWV